MRRVLALIALGACGSPPAAIDAPPIPDAAPWQAPLGAHWDPDGSAVVFRLASLHATAVELDLFDAPTGDAVATVELAPDPTPGVWTARVPAAQATTYYGYRVSGPNTPGMVDADGNRMDPSRVVFDPYAEELSQDAGARGVILADDPTPTGAHPTRALADDVIYEVHVRGFTESDAIACAGTYAGAATRADYLATLGVTAVEFTPLQETYNDQNDDDPTSDSGDDYWGYSTRAYFAPDRRYACDKSPGGPTREFRAMVAAFHARGIKVFLDVVYNHTGDASLREIDNAAYYQLDASHAGYTNNNGVSADLAVDKPLAQQLMMDSLRYWRDAMGIDGYRFDLAPVLGNTCAPSCFTFDASKLPQLDGVALIAEPWSVVPNSYEIGRFPAGWSEWNDHIRDTLRRDQNESGVTPGELATRIAGSEDLFAGRAPAASINYLVSHDGFTLHDLYACNAKNNTQGWPYGPSDGGDNTNHSWDHGGDAVAQRQAIRTGLALLALSQGVPMITGGDEMQRTIRCNNNSYDLDSPGTWLDWPHADATMTSFTSQLFAFRAAHSALRSQQWDSMTFHQQSGATVDAAYLADATRPVLAWLAGDVYVAYNRGASSQTVTLPTTTATWVREADTSSSLEPNNWNEHVMQQTQYTLAGRSLAIFVAR